VPLARRATLRLEKLFIGERENNTRFFLKRRESRNATAVHGAVAMEETRASGWCTAR
jgi:hypothetical protein